jgi:DNA-binding MarR family transcriptional regulator
MATHHRQAAAEQDAPVVEHGAGERAVAHPGAADNLLALIHMLSNRISRAFHSRLELRHDLSVAEWRVLLTLASHGSCSAMEISQRWAMEKMAVSRAVTRLEQRHHITRRRDPGDRRRFELHLTESGRAVYAAIIPIANARYREIVACLDRDELRACRESAIRLIEQVDRLPD